MTRRRIIISLLSSSYRRKVVAIDSLSSELVRRSIMGCKESKRLSGCRVPVLITLPFLLLVQLVKHLNIFSRESFRSRRNCWLFSQAGDKSLESHQECYAPVF